MVLSSAEPDGTILDWKQVDSFVVEFYTLPSLNHCFIHIAVGLYELKKIFTFDTFMSRHQEYWYLIRYCPTIT